MGLLQRLMGRNAAPPPAAALYEAVVAKGREPRWYLEGEVPDTVDGRFDMIAAVLVTVLLRLEGDPEGPVPSAALAERFVDDMDGQLRQIGFGDIVVGKHVGKMMGMLGGRLGAYREALAAGDLKPALERNLYRAGAPSEAALAYADRELRALGAALAATPTEALLAGRMPA